MAKEKYKNDRVYNIRDETSTQTTIEPVKKAKNKEKYGILYGSVFNRNIKGYTPPKKKRPPNIKQLEKDALQSIIGQDKQVKQIITAIYRALYFEQIKANVLIIGKSGTGKTATIQYLAERLRIPYTIEDATKYTKEGYYGADVNDMIFNLLENANMNIKKAEHGIIVIDEIDKKAGEEKNDISGTDVLKSLLKIVEGTMIKIPNPQDVFGESMIDFNTKNIIIIFLGAFSGLDKIRDKRLNKQSLGFATSECKSVDEKNARFTKQDLVEYGMPEEFVGRIDTIIEMNELTKKDLAMILKKSKLSIFRKYQAALRNMGISLSYNGKLFELIAEESLSLDTGARELSNTVNYMFENIIYDVIANPKKYTKCELTLEIVKDNSKYTLS